MADVAEKEWVKCNRAFESSAADEMLSKRTMQDKIKLREKIMKYSCVYKVSGILTASHEGSNMGVYGTAGGSDPRLQEKAEMNVVNDKLASYIQKVRNLGTGESDPAVFLEAVRCMENDVKKMKSMYESELEKYRQKLEEANRQKNAALSEIEANKRAKKDFEDRFRAENDKNQRLMKDINCFQKRIADLERELANVKSSSQGPQALLCNMQSDLNRENNKNKQLANELDQEKTKNKQLEDRVKTLQDKVNFNDQLSNEEKRDTANRLEQAKKMIGDLEAKNRELEKQCACLPEALEKMKRKTDQEIQQYKADMENNNKKNNDTIKRQLNDQNRTNEQLQADNAKLETENQRLMGVLRAMDAQIKELNNEKAAMEEQMRLDRSKSCEQIRALERKLKELQELLMEKMQEANASRDVQVSLRTEIEQARVLLEEEENRLNARQSSSRAGYSRGNLNSGASSQFGFTRARLESSGSDKQGADKSGDEGRRLTATKVPGQKGKFEQRTEYQFAYNKAGGRFPFGTYGRSNKGGLPVLATGKGNAGNGTTRYSMN